MIRRFEPQDLSQVTRIWLDAHIRVHGFISTEFWRRGTEEFERSLAMTDVYVSVDKHNINGFIQLDGNIVMGLFMMFGRQYKKVCLSLLIYAQSLNYSLELHAFLQDEEILKAYQSIGFTPVCNDRNEFTGEPELILQWSA